MSEQEQAPPGIDVSTPHIARVYDYALGGKDNFAVDREASTDTGKPLDLSGPAGGLVSTDCIPARLCIAASSAAVRAADQEVDAELDRDRGT